MSNTKKAKEYPVNDLPDFYSEEHKKLIHQIEYIWKNLHPLKELADKYGIVDIFQDNGAKILQQVIILNMKPLLSREGNDSFTKSGIEWEMKSINLATSAKGFSTNHHTTFDIIDKYRKVPWSFAIYHGIKLEEIYVMTPQQLEPIFSKWEDQLPRRTHGIFCRPLSQDSLITADL